MYGEGASKNYKMSCNSDNRCAPSYTNLRDIKFMASGTIGTAPQTCEDLSQGSGAKYFEIGDFQKKNQQGAPFQWAFFKGFLPFFNGF